MQPDISKVHFLTGNAVLLKNAVMTPALRTWDDNTIEFFAAFSRNLLKDSRTRGFADISSYAFWIRKASLLSIKNHYYANKEDKLGRGIAFHIAPSNVPVNFAVSFTSSLLAGNINIVRVSNKEYEQVEIIIDNLKKTFHEGFQNMEKYLILVRYEHDREITGYFSSICDVRIIWGGNRTINSVRESKLPPRAIELSFADRHSISMIDSDAIMHLKDMQKLASDFYTDTFYIDQNACSSPRIVIWFGEKTEKAKEVFWSAVEELVESEYRFRDIQAVDKLNQFCRLAAANPDVHLVNHNNKVMRIEVPVLHRNLMDYKLGGGYFFEYNAEGMDELLPILGKSAQTISLFGIDAHKVQRFVLNHGIRGCDRIVPIGKTMDLTFKWDGFDMIETMSRYVYCPDYKSVDYCNS